MMIHRSFCRSILLCEISNIACEIIFTLCIANIIHGEGKLVAVSGVPFSYICEIYADAEDAEEDAADHRAFLAKKKGKPRRDSSKGQEGINSKDYICDL